MNIKLSIKEIKYIRQSLEYRSKYYEDKPQYDPPLRSVASEKYAKDYDENGFYTSELLYGYSVTKEGKE